MINDTKHNHLTDKKKGMAKKVLTGLIGMTATVMSFTPAFATGWTINTIQEKYTWNIENSAYTEPASVTIIINDEKYNFDNIQYIVLSSSPIESGNSDTTSTNNVKIENRKGYETKGLPVYNDPNNPVAAAYPAQGYRSDGTPINLFEPGATGGIGGNGSFKEWRDNVQADFDNALPDYLGGQDTCSW